MSCDDENDAPRTKNRPTAEEEQEREDFAYELLSRCLHKSQIKQQFYEKYSPISARTVEKYISRARGRMATEATRAKDDLRAESLSFYLSMLRGPDSTPREKILARERIDKLFGLDTPTKVALTDPTGENEYSGLSDSELNARILAALTPCDERGIPSSAGAEGGEEGISGG